jgi:hypothetical protein
VNPVAVEKHQTLNSTKGVIFCPQVYGCTDEEILVGLADQYASKAYHVHRKQEGTPKPPHIIFILKLRQCLNG